MKLLYYTPVLEGVGQGLQMVIETMVPKEAVEICHTIDSLTQRLRQAKNDFFIFILLAASQKDLSDIFTIRQLLSDLRLILILPDTEEDTIAKGHLLRPRFLYPMPGNLYLDSDLAFVSAVLNQMLKMKVGLQDLGEQKCLKSKRSSSR